MISYMVLDEPHFRTVWRKDNRFTDYLISSLWCAPVLVRVQANKAWLLAVQIEDRWDYLKNRLYIVNRKKTVFELHMGSYVTNLFLTRFGLKTEAQLVSMTETEGDVV